MLLNLVPVWIQTMSVDWHRSTPWRLATGSHDRTVKIWNLNNVTANKLTDHEAHSRHPATLSATRTQTVAPVLTLQASGPVSRGKEMFHNENESKGCGGGQRVRDEVMCCDLGPLAWKRLPVFNRLTCCARFVEGREAKACRAVLFVCLFVLNQRNETVCFAGVPLSAVTLTPSSTKTCLPICAPGTQPELDTPGMLNHPLHNPHTK